MERKLLALTALSIIILNPVAAIDFSVTPAETSFTLQWGETAEASVNIRSQNSWYKMDCDVKKNGQTVTKVNNIEAGQTKSGSYSFTAPNSGSADRTVDMSVYCKDEYGANKTKDYIVDLEYPVQGQISADSNIDDAESRINSANSEVDEAENEVSEAESMGGSVNEAQNSIDSANSNLDEANDYLSRANDAYGNNNFQLAQDYANTAKENADSAISNANNALSEAEEAIQQRKEEAQSEIGNTENKLDDLRSTIDTLDSKIETAESKGLSVRNEGQKLENYRSSLSEAESSLEDARTSFDSNNYGTAINIARETLNKAKSDLNDLESTINSLEKSIPDTGESEIPQDASSKIKSLVSSDEEMSERKAELKSNSFQREDIAITPSTGTTYSVEIIYTHSSGETMTLSSTVNTAEERVNDISLSGNPYQINQRWEENRNSQQTMNSVLMFAGAAILLIIAGSFAYYFVNPVNKTVNNFVGGEDSDESSSGSKFDCPSCGAPVTPDDLEEGECPYCGATVSP